MPSRANVFESLKQFWVTRITVGFEMRGMATIHDATKVFENECRRTLNCIQGPNRPRNYPYARVPVIGQIRHIAYTGNRRMPRHLGCRCGRAKGFDTDHSYAWKFVGFHRASSF